MNWTKSSYSLANGNCVEVADLPDGDVGVRDSKDPDGPVLRFTADEWRAFIRGIRSGVIAPAPPVTGALTAPRGNGIALSKLMID